MTVCMQRLKSQLWNMHHTRTPPLPTAPTPRLILQIPIFTGKPGGKLRVTKSRRRAKWELVRAIRSMIGVTCSTRESGCSSLIHKVPLNLQKGDMARHIAL